MPDNQRTRRLVKFEDAHTVRIEPGGEAFQTVNDDLGQLVSGTRVQRVGEGCKEVFEAVTRILRPSITGDMVFSTRIGLRKALAPAVLAEF